MPQIFPLNKNLAKFLRNQDREKPEATSASRSLGHVGDFS